MGGVMSFLRAFCALFFVLLYPISAYSVDELDLSGKLNVPNKIVADSKFLYISNTPNIESTPSKKGDGFISKLNKQGRVIDAKFISNLNAPQGMAVLNNILYVADMNMIKGFNLSTKKQIFTMQIGTDSYLQDLLVYNNMLFVSDRNSGAIFEIDIKKKTHNTFIMLDTSQGVPNSILLHDDRIYFVTKLDSTFNILNIDIHTKSATTISTLSGRLSSIAFTRDGGLLIGHNSENNELDSIFKIHENGEIFKVDIKEDLRGFGYFMLDSNVLFMLDSNNSKLLILSV